MKYSFVKLVSVTSLKQELSLSMVKNRILDVSATGTLVEVTTDRTLSAHEHSVLRALIVAHNSAEDIVKQKIQAAIVFGQSLLVEIAAENVLMQLSVPQITTMLVKFAGIKAMLESGSLYTALAAMEKTPPDQVVSQERLNKYIKKIKKYLGLPL